MQKEDGMNGVGTRFTELDKVTSGWQKSDMIVVAARPGMGKTAFVFLWLEMLLLITNTLLLFSL